MLDDARDLVRRARAAQQAINELGAGPPPSTVPELWYLEAIAEIERLRAALTQAMTEASIYRGLLIYSKPWEPKYQESWEIMEQQASAALAPPKAC